MHIISPLGGLKEPPPLPGAVQLYAVLRSINPVT